MINHHIEIDNTTNIHFITLENGPLKAVFLNFGARMYQFFIPDKQGKQENIFLSIDSPIDIINDNAQFGALVGPVAGRIKQAKWQQVALEKNAGQHHIHGGSKGWSHQFWPYEINKKKDSISVTFSLNDTFSGYPGPIGVETTYELTTEGILMTTTCQTEQLSIVNPTNHVYINLSGNAKRDILNHQLTVPSSSKLMVDDDTIPTGDILDVTNSPFDFRKGKRIKEFITSVPIGLDDTFLLDNKESKIYLTDQESGRRLCLRTNRKAVVVFSTTGFNDSFAVNGQTMRSNLGLALETQELPDIVHHPDWGNIEIEKNDIKVFKTYYQVSY